MQNQPLKAQQGEIEFRKKLIRQQVGGENVFSDEFSSKEIENILLNRINKTIHLMSSLITRNIALSPYVEIGAERGQRSLAMENNMGLNGAAIDISFDMLKSCNHYQKVFKKEKAPQRICCDVYTLPFSSNSIPFAFCYQVLHHFPDPGIVLKELYRMLLPGGHFYFDEEPYEKKLHLNLYKRKVYAKGTINERKIWKAIDYFFAREIKNEEDYSIVENDEISLKTWKQILQIFNEKEITITSVRKIRSDLFNPENRIIYLMATLLGGEISGLCRKDGLKENHKKNINETLICPSCLNEKIEARVMQQGDIFQCVKCRKKYPLVDGILFLFPYDKLSELYPDIFKSIGA
jgi:ubiquinone/menaquinone biosynthesis C-methylase UbiE